ncbi:MAG: hypothetical protein DRP63_06635 [Planctomycetota bacterium]|nr:MAG: hypothetical protein DRP63_06635 [Planctomycetota bacterium]
MSEQEEQGLKTVVYRCGSLADMPIRVPSDSYSRLCAFLEGKKDLGELRRFPTLRRFLRHIEALVDVCKQYGFGWRKAAEEAELGAVLDYFVLRFCEIELFEAQRKAHGGQLAAMLRIYSVIAETARRLENRAITEAVRVDMFGRDR